MATRILSARNIVINFIKKCNTPTCGTSIGLPIFTNDLAKLQLPSYYNVRNKSFFKRRSAEELWKSVTSVSNAGKKRGRAKGLKRKIDLNKGQRIGFGKTNVAFPGLNTNILDGTEMRSTHLVADDSEIPKESVEAQQKPTVPRRRKIHPMERGWSGGQLGGRKIGPPSTPEGVIDGFETWILRTKTCNVMTSIFGRRRRSAVMVVTGNGKGIAGFAEILHHDLKSALSCAKNRAAQRLMYIQRYNDHTVLHDFYTQFGRSKIFVKKKHEGYGLVCHRAIKTCCEAIGIKDLYAKVEGSKNVRYIIRAFFIGLLKQKSHQQLADEKKLHLVEFREENNNFPVVVASPAEVRKPEEILPNEILDLEQYVMDGRIVTPRYPRIPFYTKLPSWTIYLRRQERVRNHDKVRIRLLAEYGEVRSFLADKYPEANVNSIGKKPEESEESIE